MAQDRLGCTNPPTQTGVTDENGRFVFNVPPGTYQMSVTPPAGYRPAPPKTVVVEDGATAVVTFELDRERDWFETLFFFIPKTIREPWYGDICESRAIMISEGRSRAFIGWATAVQLVWSVAHSAVYLTRELIVALLRRFIIGP